MRRRLTAALTPKALGLTIPDSVLVSAEKVIR